MKHSDLCNCDLCRLTERVESLEDRVAYLEHKIGADEDEVFVDAQGIDAYWRTGEIEWDKVATDGAVFTILKATEGVDYLNDPERARWFEAQSRDAADAGLLLSYYHYARPDNMDGMMAVGSDITMDAMDEAQDFLEALLRVPTPDRCEYGPNRTASVWLDLEVKCPDLNQSEGLTWVRVWIDEVERAGYPVGLYTSKSWLEREVGNPEVLLTRPDGTERAFWVARYGVNDGNLPDAEQYPPEAKVPEAWGTYDVWQYTSKAETPGVEKPGDRSIAPSLKRTWSMRD